MLSTQIHSVHICYLVSFKFYLISLCFSLHRNVECLLGYLPARPTIDAKIHQMRILLAGERCPRQRLRFVLRAGRDLPPTEEPRGTQRALSCISSAMVVSKLFGRIIYSRSMLQKYVYMLGRHISLEWLLGILRKKNPGVLQMLL